MSAPPMGRRVAYVSIFLIFSLAILLLLIETAAFAAFRIARPETPSDWLLGAQERVVALEDDCAEMTSHSLLPYVHNHVDGCEIVGGRADGPFVEYEASDDESEAMETVVTLGGSTTDGFFQQFADGLTWPLQLHQRMNESGLRVRVLNGGVGGYGSSQEVIRLITDVTFLEPTPSLILSLNGINDIEGYMGTAEPPMEHFPMYRPSQLRAFCDQRWVRQDGRSRTVVLPSTLRALGSVGRDLGQRYAFELGPSLDDCARLVNIQSSRVTSDAGPMRWARNIDVAHGAAKGIGTTYLQFLQPTLGLDYVAPPASGSNDDDLLKQLDSEYVRGLNRDYAVMRRECAKRDFCIDISEVLAGSADSYSDARHPNARGNAEIARVMWDELEKRDLLPATSQ